VATPAYDRGRQAFDAGRDEKACPFHDARQREAWMRGWNDAKQKANSR
jgi:ribosome modulation factor